MKNRSIVTKIVASSCGIISVLLLLGSFVLIEFEINIVKTFMDEHLKMVRHSIDERGHAEKTSLNEKIHFKLKILNGFGRLHIHHFEVEELMNALKLFMSSPEITAIKVLTDDDAPFAAAWREPEIRVGSALPDHFKLDESLSVHIDAMLRDRKIGRFYIYYTDKIITDKIVHIREKMSSEMEILERHSYERLYSGIYNQIAGIFFILLVLMISLIFILRPLVLKPITVISDIARRLANFDLTVSVNSGRLDEIGMLLIAINNMVLEFRKIVSDVKFGGEHLANASGEMTNNINMIASASQDMSANVHNVSNTATHLSQNINAVAGAIEEMSASINDAGKNARQGSHIAAEAVKMAEKAGNTMTSLGEAASQIGEVTEVIKRIAEKTTLLALNADIEAASAGEAGRGFGVVANEIKAFARQSTQAADDIAARISLMQESTNQAVTVIGDVSSIIDTINSSSETITFSLEEQMNAVNEIAVNALQADARANEIAASMAQLSQGANEISMNVGMAARGRGVDAKDDEGSYMDASAAEVARLANELLELVDKFKIYKDIE